MNRKSFITILSGAFAALFVSPKTREEFHGSFVMGSPGVWVETNYTQNAITTKAWRGESLVWFTSTGILGSTEGEARILAMKSARKAETWAMVA